MVRVRKLVLAIAAASALSSGMAHALGLGEVTLRSALNQPLLAEIELLETRDLSSNELVPALASQEDFSKAGVDRQYFLSDLKFTSVVKPNGKSVILVTSSKPMREPYLNFLVEVLWPNGRLLREYTLLLDPPLYTPQSVIPANTQMPVASAPAPRIQPAPVTSSPLPAVAVNPAPRPSAAAPAAVPSQAKPATRALSDSEYRTTPHDTLWEIARSSRGNSNVHQVMLAIQDLNPGAFIDGNINRLKSGQVLRLPSDEQIRSRSRNDAVAQVAEQNNAWREGRRIAAAPSARQLDATRRTAAEPAPAKVEQTDSLKLVAADTGKAAVGSEAGSADSKALADKLAVTQESLDSSRRESAELKSRLEDLQSQLDKLQRLMELKDSQLAKLQADLAAPKEPAVAPATVAETPVAAPAVAPAAEAPVAASAPVVTEAPAEEVAEAPKVAETQPAAETDYNYAEEPAAEPAAPTASAEPVVEAPAAPAAPAAPVADADDSTAPKDDILASILANPLWLGLAGGAALLALLLALMIVSRRNALKEAELQQNLAADSDKPDDLDPDMQLPDDSFEGLNDSAETAQAESASDERVTAQTADVLGEADIYIAYGRFPQAAELLEGAIKEEPQRTDLRLKLMEVYAEMGEQSAFASQEEALRSLGAAQSDIDQLKSKYPSVAPMAAAAIAGGALAAAPEAEADELNLDDLVLDEPAASVAQEVEAAPVQAMPTDLDDAFDLSLDDLEAELDRELQAPAQAPADAELDLDALSLDSDEFTASFDEIQSAELATADTLEFDLGLSDERDTGATLENDLADFSLDLEEPAQPTAASLDDEFLLSLDDEPVVEPVSAPAAPVPDTEALAQDKLEHDFDLAAEFDLAESDEPAAQPSADTFAAQLDKVSAELDGLSVDLAQADQTGSELPAFDDLDADDDFDFLSGADESATKLDLARAYIDMGDADGARDILNEVINEGNEGQQQEARELIAKLV
ncbi:FimV/HubP family polar landmark protein [Ectopseudomonas mendocina]|uniref:FimV/HubP family polar landmark protein n=1 Tax=Ectopseudomonas mendocina TaxID=300 RepID=A0ABZ2REN7_ECTME